MSGPRTSGGGPPEPSPSPGPPSSRGKNGRLPSAEPGFPDGPAGSPPLPRRFPREDLALLVLACAALIVPGWLSGPAAGRPRLAGAPEAPRKIDLNRCPWYEWTLLPGIGEVRARRLVALREERRGFRSLGELEELPGMPRGWTEKIRPFVRLGPPAPAGEAEPAGAMMSPRAPDGGARESHGR